VRKVASILLGLLIVIASLYQSFQFSTWRSRAIEPSAIQITQIYSEGSFAMLSIIAVGIGLLLIMQGLIPAIESHPPSPPEEEK